MNKKTRMFILSLVDIDILYIVYIISMVIASSRYNFPISMMLHPTTIILLASYLLVFKIAGINNTIWRYATESDYVKVFTYSALACFIFYAVVGITFFHNVVIFYWFIPITLSASAVMLSRIMYRFMISSKHSDEDNSGKKRLLIVGAGECGSAMLNEIFKDKNCGLYPIGFADDDPQKIQRLINGVEVLGKVSDIPGICRDKNVDLIYIAIPSASNATRAVILDECAKTGCPVKIIPYYTQFTENEDRAFIERVREITPEELLGREPIKVADENILGFIKGKTVAITGGGGSIGSELCRQIAAHSPKRLIIIDIYENNAYAIQQELIDKYGTSLNLAIYIASVREYEKIDYIFGLEKPDYVFHAAAHKHVPLMEGSPDEAVKNNIFGTYNTAQAALNNKVSRFVLISTDKAVNPANIMGATKRVCEMIIQYFNHISNGTTIFAAVRFGNVLGSNGSVIPLFKEQIKERHDVTVTHPEMTRYFMTIPEASQLVLTAAAMADKGEIYVLDMGQPVKIDDLAKKMISLSGLKLGIDIKIRYIGLRPGEKMDEELFMSEEGLNKTSNQKIFIGSLNPINYNVFINQLDKLYTLSYKKGVTAYDISHALADIVPSFKHSEAYSPVDKKTNKKASYDNIPVSAFSHQLIPQSSVVMKTAMQSPTRKQIP